MAVKLKEKNNSLLSNLQKRLINKKNQGNEYKKHVFETEIDRSKNESNMKIEKMKLTKEEMDADLQVEIEELKAQPVKNALSKLKNQNDYNNLKNDIRKREITTLLDKSKTLNLMSLMCSLFSGIMTSCCILKSNIVYQYKIVAVVIIIFGAVAENFGIKIIHKYYNDFYEKGSIFKTFAYTTLLLIIVLYTGYSVKTNFDFWANTNIDGFGQVIISGIFDLIAISYALISDDFLFLNFNGKKQEETEEEIDVNSIIFNAKFGNVAGGQPKQNDGK